MIRYAVRVTPWLLLGTGCGVIAGLMALTAARPAALWPLQGTCVGLIAGLVAIAVDERCAGIVDTLPRGLVWRTTARVGIVVPALLAVWVGALLVWRDDLPPHRGLFVLQGVGAVAVALTVTGWRRATGVAEPGASFAAVVIPTVIALALIRPWARWLPLFPIWPGEKWPLSHAIWWGLAAGLPATAVLAAGLRGRLSPRRPPRPGPTAPPGSLRPGRATR